MLSFEGIRFYKRESKSYLSVIFLAKQCMELRNISLDQTILLPCYTSLGSTCHFGCRPGFFLKGDGHAKCIIDSKGGGVSWSFGQFSCKGKLFSFGLLRYEE